MGYRHLTVQIVRFVSNDPFPGVIACEFVDADGSRHTLIDKVPIFSVVSLDATSSYPQLGAVRCGVLAQWKDAHERDLARISIAHPDDVESTEGLSEFVVLSKQRYS